MTLFFAWCKQNDTKILCTHSESKQSQHKSLAHALQNIRYISCQLVMNNWLRCDERLVWRACDFEQYFHGNMLFSRLNLFFLLIIYCHTVRHHENAYVIILLMKFSADENIFFHRSVISYILRDLVEFNFIIINSSSWFYWKSFVSVNL